MSKSEISIEKQYEQGCHFLRHYSTLLQQVRITTIVQGIVIASGSLVITNNSHEYFYIYGCVTGMAFTTFLFGLHWNYLAYFESIQKSLLELEKKFSPKEFEGFLIIPETTRNDRLKKPFFRIFVVNGVFVFAFLLMLSIFAIKTVSC